MRTAALVVALAALVLLVLWWLGGRARADMRSIATRTADLPDAETAPSEPTG